MKHFIKKLIETLKRKWVEYLLEVFVIIIGIIGAFMLDSWKETRENQKEEQVILKGLKEEFEENLSELERNVSLNQKAIASMYSLMELLRTEYRFADMKLVDSLISEINLFGSFDAHTGYVDEVVGAGKLSLIRNHELKKQLTSWSGLLRNAQEDYVLRIDQYSHLLLPIIIKHFPMANADLYIDFSSWSKSYSVTKKEPTPLKARTDNINFLELENVIWQHKLNNDYVVLNELEMIKFVNETLELIESNIK